MPRPLSFAHAPFIVPRARFVIPAFGTFHLFGRAGLPMSHKGSIFVGEKPEPPKEGIGFLLERLPPLIRGVFGRLKAVLAGGFLLSSGFGRLISHNDAASAIS